MSTSLFRTAGAALLGLALVSAAPASWAGPKHCPPGHAKKGWCTPGASSVPPGLRKGDRLSRDRYVVIDDYARHGLAVPDDGYRYVRVDERIVLIAAATGLIIDILSD